MHPQPPRPLGPEERREALGLLARAPAARLAALLAQFPAPSLPAPSLPAPSLPAPSLPAPSLPAHEILRAPETGTVMVRGRVGGTGAAFNLGEITVTRASVRLEGGAVGHGYVQGRDRDHALRVALVDALGQSDARLVAPIIAPLRTDEEAARAATGAEAEATRVEFFTLLRGEDE